ncbi:MAG: sigma-70 family RNA polymerase sigma factor [Myxococcaceae bacterium]|nr:sigma-70 family RNA polymerase sigma factor [Myxococcaceae bacterium]
MPEPLDLAATFLSHVRGRLVPPSGATELNRALAQALEAARAWWPEVKLAPELFMRHLAERLPGPRPELSLEALLGQLRVEELYLACACLHQAPLAVKTFEQHYLRKLPRLLGQRERSAAAIDEICQLASVRILVATDEGPPRIAEYKGVGELLSWVRVIAARIAIRQRQGPEVAPEEPDPDLPDPLHISEDPGLRFIKQHHHEDLRHAFREAFSSLTDEDRYLLRLYYVDRLSMYKMEPLLRTSQPTISRRMTQIREKLGAEIRRHLQARLGVSAQDFQSFINLVDSQFDLHLSQMLGEAAAPDRPRPPR